MLTLVHEDIYLYIDKVELLTKRIITTNNNLVLENDAIDTVTDKGKITISILDGSYTQLIIGEGNGAITFEQPLPEGSQLVLDFSNNYFTLDNQVIFLDKELALEDGVYHAIPLAFSGTGKIQVDYEYLAPFENNQDLMFLTSIDVSESHDIQVKNNIKNKTKYINSAKNTYQWSINALWNEQEREKFNSSTGLFRVRLVDEEGNEMEKLANCSISSEGKSSSDSGDYTLQLQGNCEQIF